jgi:hypothetical protein
LVLQLEPNRLFAAREVRSGRLPLWNPCNYCGAPFLAGNQPAVFSPFRLIDYIWPGPISIAWGQLIRQLVAGLGAYLFFRRVLRVGFIAAAMGAWCFPLGGFLMLWAGYLQSWEVTWLPLLLWATYETARRPRAPMAAALGIVTACVLVSGHSATGTQMLLLDAAFALWALHRRYGSKALIRRRGLQAGAYVLGGWLVGALLSLPQTLPTLEYMQSSLRIAARQHGYVETASRGPDALLDLILPLYHGKGGADSIYLDKGNPLESTPAGYAGLVLTLVVAPLAWLSRRHRGLLIFWLISAVVGVGQILAIPGLSALYRLPLINTLRNNRLVFITEFAVITWAVVAVHALWRQRLRRRWVVVLVLAPLAIGALCLYRAVQPPPALEASLLAFKTPFGAPADSAAARHITEQISRWFTSMYLGGVTWCAIAIAVALMCVFVRRRAIVVIVIASVTLTELLVRGWGQIPQADSALYYPRLRVFDVLATRPPGRMCGLGCLPANLSLVPGLRDIRGYDSADPILITRLLLTLGALNNGSPPYAVTQWLYPKQESPNLDLLNLRYLITSSATMAQNPQNLKMESLGDGYALIERPGADTRVFVPKNIKLVRSEAERLQRISQLTWDPRDELLLEQPVDVAASAINGRASIVQDEPSQVVVQASMQTPGFVLLADQWDVGWRAYVDGQRQPILRGDQAFRAVQLPAGEHRVEFRYEPMSFTIGCWGAAGGSAIIAAMLASHRRGASTAV